MTLKDLEFYPHENGDGVAIWEGESMVGQWVPLVGLKYCVIELGLREQAAMLAAEHWVIFQSLEIDPYGGGDIWR